MLGTQLQSESPLVRRDRVFDRTTNDHDIYAFLADRPPVSLLEVSVSATHDDRLSTGSPKIKLFTVE